MKKDTKPANDPALDEDDEEPTAEEKLFYQMIWGKVWDEEYPPSKPASS